MGWLERQMNRQPANIIPLTKEVIQMGSSINRISMSTFLFAMSHTAFQLNEKTVQTAFKSLKVWRAKISSL